MSKSLDPLHVEVRFGSGVPSRIQAKAMFDFERALRALAPGLWIEVFKEPLGDDSKLRNLMTPEERAKL